jgi:hypothetical protein
MRTIVLTGLVVLALLIVLPAAVSAAESDTVTVTGSINGYIDVSAASKSLSFGAMTVSGSPYTQSTSITVITSYPSWGVDVAGTNDGFMYDSATSTKLATAFQLGKNGLNYTTLPITDYMSGLAAGETTATANARQAIVTADPVGSYSIIVTFTGAAN